MLQIAEVQDLFCDAYVTDENMRLVFISLIGRDTAIQQLLASFSLPLQSGGLDRISFRNSSEGNVIFVGDHTRLEKLTGRLPKSIFGILNQTWIFDPVCQKPDRANKVAWLLEPNRQSNGPGLPSIWPTIKMLSSIALLDAWERQLVNLLARVEPHVSAYGVTALKVSLKQDYEAIVSAAVRNGELAIPELSSSKQLELV